MAGMSFAPSMATHLINEYFERKRLAELGYRFETENLSDADATTFSFIADCLIDEENRRMKRKAKVK